MRIDPPESTIPAYAFGGARPFGFHAPAWAEFVVSDHDGMVWAFQHCPLADAATRSWTAGAITGRYALLGSCRQEIPNWRDVILHRHGGLWRSLHAEQEDEREADFRSATSGTLWAIAMLAMVVMTVLAVESTFF
ncbi:hypothetical protein LF41_2862 [Lysobacter dokdonensis DS-58]|uniref:Uncharacterized protein n=1 Tax=Lysobacter dokdonensis DS-58 TaxID=1300345 RepID=A0A0A2WGB6_9GAMM|nr:hypothetical protein [Lysobacter dokdonensis]KGQ19216.1 hypothetical protein LF41_2862 [Lysobacter dokdonensis DS-58]